MYFCEFYYNCIVLPDKRIKGFIAFTTIGYGDYAPRTDLGRAIFVFWALFGVGTMTVLFAGMSSELYLFPFLDGFVFVRPTGSSYRCFYFWVSLRYTQQDV
jgi:Ion channel